MAFVVDDDILHFLSRSNNSNGNHGLTDGTFVQKGQDGSGGDDRYGREGTRREPGSSPSALNRKPTHHGRNIEDDDVEYVEQEIAVTLPVNSLIFNPLLRALPVVKKSEGIGQPEAAMVAAVGPLHTNSQVRQVQREQRAAEVVKVTSSDLGVDLAADLTKIEKFDKLIRKIYPNKCGREVNGPCISGSKGQSVYVTRRVQAGSSSSVALKRVTEEEVTRQIAGSYSLESARLSLVTLDLAVQAANKVKSSCVNEHAEVPHNRPKHYQDSTLSTVYRSAIPGGNSMYLTDTSFPRPSVNIVDIGSRVRIETETETTPKLNGLRADSLAAYVDVGGDQKRPSQQQPSGHSKSPRKVNIRIPCLLEESVP
jgi:hypothetical protein